MVELYVILLNGGPILPPAKLSIAISIEVPEATFEVTLGNVRVRVVPLEHHIILLVPLFIGHYSIVFNSFADISGALGVVPEAADELVMPVVLVLLPRLDDAVIVGVANLEFLHRVNLIAHTIVDNVFETVNHGQNSLEVFIRIALGCAGLVLGGRPGFALDVVEKRVFALNEGRQAALKVKGHVLHPVVLKKLHKTDFVVIVEIHQLILSDIFCSVSTTLADIADQGLELSVGDLAILNALVEVGEVEFS